MKTFLAFCIHLLRLSVFLMAVLAAGTLLCGMNPPKGKLLEVLIGASIGWIVAQLARLHVKIDQAATAKSMCIRCTCEECTDCRRIMGKP